MGRAAGPWWDQLTVVKGVQSAQKCSDRCNGMSWSKGTNKISAINIKWHRGSNGGGVGEGGNFNLTSNLQREQRADIRASCAASSRIKHYSRWWPADTAVARIQWLEDHDEMVTPSQHSLAPSTLVLTNQRPVSWSRDLCRPIRDWLWGHVIQLNQWQTSVGGDQSRGWNLRSLHNYSLKTARAIPSPRFLGHFSALPAKTRSWWISSRPVVCILVSFILAEQQVSYHLWCQRSDLLTSFTIFQTNSDKVHFCPSPILSVLKLPKIVKTNPDLGPREPLTSY